MTLVAAPKDANGMTVHNSDAGRAITPHGRWGDDTHSAATKSRLRRTHVHHLVIYMRCDNTGGGTAPCRPRDNNTHWVEPSVFVSIGAVGVHARVFHNDCALRVRACLTS